MKQKITKLINKTEVCELLGVSSSTLARMIHNLEIMPPVEIAGRSVRFPLSEIEDYINQKIGERNERL